MGEETADADDGLRLMGSQTGEVYQRRKMVEVGGVVRVDDESAEDLRVAFA